ncbi:hypothetical protein STAL104432_31490 [Streptomyces albus]
MDRPSDSCSAAELRPASSGADSRSINTLSEEMIIPMPKQPMPMARVRTHTGTGSNSTSGAQTRARVTSAMPIRTRRSRWRSMPGRDWVKEPSAHSRPPAARVRPAMVTDSPRWVTSISGTKLSATM